MPTITTVLLDIIVYKLLLKPETMHVNMYSNMHVKILVRIMSPG